MSQHQKQESTTESKNFVQPTFVGAMRMLMGLVRGCGSKTSKTSRTSYGQRGLY